jgi:[protein-PII] uridylyltransferase
LQILSGAPPKFREAERVREIAERVRALLEGKTPGSNRPVNTAGVPSSAATGSGEIAWPDEHFASLPLHYLTATPPEQIARDIIAIRQLAPGDNVVRGNYDESTSTVEYRMITRDTVGSGLFHKVTGVLTAKGLEILSANICTTTAGIVIDSFRVHDGDHADPVPDFRLHEIEGAIDDVISGRTSVEYLFERHRRRLRRESAPVLREPTRVVIDNDSSERFTVIDVFAHDRRGLLYTIASLLLELGLSVSLAKISTHLDQVLDVFYVTDREGVKLRDEGRLNDIQNILSARIEEFETHGLVATAAF